MNDNQDTQEQMPAYTISVALKPQEIEVMRQLFFHGPTWDGNIISKSSRDALFDLKLATRVEGWSWLTADGVRMALANRLDREKEKWERERRKRQIKLDSIEEIILPPKNQERAVLPTTSELERILTQPEGERR